MGYEAWDPEENGWVEVDASDSKMKTRTHVLLHGSTRTWKRIDVADKNLLFKCLGCGKEIRQTSIVRVLCHVLGIGANDKVAAARKS